MDIPKNPSAPALPLDKLPNVSDLDKLIAESEEAIKRLDSLQRRADMPLTQRLRRHFHKNSPHLINVLLAGSVLVVAMGRLQQKHEFQVGAGARVGQACPVKRRVAQARQVAHSMGGQRSSSAA